MSRDFDYDTTSLEIYEPKIPLSISGLKVWIDASMIQGVSSGDPLSAITNRAPEQEGFILPSTTSRIPHYLAPGSSYFSNLPAIEFDYNEHQYIQCVDTSLTEAAEMTMISVMRGGHDQMIFCGASTNSSQYFSSNMVHSNMVFAFEASDRTYAGGKTVEGSVLFHSTLGDSYDQDQFDDKVSIYSQRLSLTKGKFSVASQTTYGLNLGVWDCGTGTPSSVGAPYLIGAANFNATDRICYYSAQVGDFLLYDKYISDDDLDKVMSYFKDKYSL